jgi:hypothetical protein
MVDSTVDLCVNVPSWYNLSFIVKSPAELAVAAYDALITLPNRYEAVNAYDALVEFDAQLAVPNSDPVNPLVDVIEPVTTKLPVITADPVYGKDTPPPPPPFKA